MSNISLFDLNVDIWGNVFNYLHPYEMVTLSEVCKDGYQLMLCDEEMKKIFRTKMASFFNIPRPEEPHATLIFRIRNIIYEAREFLKKNPQLHHFFPDSKIPDRFTLKQFEIIDQWRDLHTFIRAEGPNYRDDIELLLNSADPISGGAFDQLMKYKQARDMYLICVKVRNRIEHPQLRNAVVEIRGTLDEIVEASKREKLWCEQNSEEVKKITSLNFENCALLSLDLSAFPSLKTLNVKGNCLKELDASMCPSLTQLDHEGNPFRFLDVSGTKLAELVVTRTLLSHVRMNQCENLKLINIQRNQIESFDPGQFPNLETLCLIGNIIRSLDLSQNKKLLELDVGANKIKSLILASENESSNIEWINVSSNCLKELNISVAPNLQSLTCTDNKLDSLDIRKNKQLKNLMIQGNPIKCLDVSNQKDLQVFGDEELEIINESEK